MFKARHLLHCGVEPKVRTTISIRLPGICLRLEVIGAFNSREGHRRMKPREVLLEVDRFYFMVQNSLGGLVFQHLGCFVKRIPGSVR